jgi:hypothetical protein
MMLVAPREETLHLSARVRGMLKEYVDQFLTGVYNGESHIPPVVIEFINRQEQRAVVACMKPISPQEEAVRISAQVKGVLKNMR